MLRKRNSKLMRACKEKKLLEYADEYLHLCSESEAEGERKSAKRVPSRFPNIAGFCRYMRVGPAELERVRGEYPEQYDALSAIFEDEALNSGVSSALIGSYLKKRLGYSDREECSGVNVCFEHDILADGE